MRRHVIASTGSISQNAIPYQHVSDIETQIKKKIANGIFLNNAFPNQDSLQLKNNVYSTVFISHKNVFITSQIQNSKFTCSQIHVEKYEMFQIICLNTLDGTRNYDRRGSELWL